MKNIYALCLWLTLALLGGCATSHAPGRSADKDHAKTYTLVLLRHGESLWNKEDRFTGWSDVPLTEKGEAGALKAGKLLKAEGFAMSYANQAVKQYGLEKTKNLKFFIDVLAQSPMNYRLVTQLNISKNISRSIELFCRITIFG